MTVNTGVNGAFIAITSTRLITVGAVFCDFAPIIHAVRYFGEFTHALITCVYGADVSITAPFASTEAVNLTIAVIETSRVYAVVDQNKLTECVVAGQRGTDIVVTTARFGTLFTGVEWSAFIGTFWRGDHLTKSPKTAVYSTYIAITSSRAVTTGVESAGCAVITGDAAGIIIRIGTTSIETCSAQA
jgi:hypothetical protein